LSFWFHWLVEAFPSYLRVSCAAEAEDAKSATATMLVHNTALIIRREVMTCSLYQKSQKLHRLQRIHTFRPGGHARLRLIT